MRDKVLRWCRENALLAPGQTVFCAVSGGADSVAMLHILCSLREALGMTVSAAHFNHRLRGAESDRTKPLSGSSATIGACRWPRPPGDAAARARETGESLEEAARNLRYAFFASLGQAVATAHTADDNLETMLLNFLRGTGLTGLGGIPPKRDFLVRPILCCTRQEVLAYLDAHRLPHVEDSTNAADDCVRNRLRHNVLPLLKAKILRLPKPPCAQRSCCGGTTHFWIAWPKRRCKPPAPGRWRGAATRCARSRRRPHPRRPGNAANHPHPQALARAHRSSRPTAFTDDPSAASPSPAAGKRGGNMAGSASRARRTQPHSCPFRSYREDHPHSGAWAENSL